jgi:ATP-dependent DNA helicase RecG
MKLTQSTSIQEGLNALNIETYEDVLRYFPRTYQDFSLTQDVLLVDKQKYVFFGEIKSTPKLSRMGKLTMIQFYYLTQEGVYISVVAFNRPYLLKMVTVGNVYTLSGTYDGVRKVINLSTIVAGSMEGTLTYKPIYRLPSTLENYQFIRLVKKAFSKVKDDFYMELLPITLRTRYQLIDCKKAYFQRHFPLDMYQAEAAIQYFKYVEAFQFNTKIQQFKVENFIEKKVKVSTLDRRQIEQFIETLPAPLTGDQRQVVFEIINDFHQPFFMNRLLQGDVGSGKTWVASIALFANALRGLQGALMAPTDALAKQHVKTLTLLFKDTPYRIELLVGSMDTSEKKRIKEGLKNGTVDIVVGTHALFSLDVQYLKLGFVTIDEQHRFGSNQRDALQKKGKQVDMLMMSATPIPRSLAMTLYADMDVSTLVAFPFAKREIQTKIVLDDDALIDYAIEEALANQKHIYIIAPFIKSNEEGRYDVDQLFHLFQKKYPHKVSLLHGQLTTEAKEISLTKFADGTTPILVSTTVVEVGIDVKAATTMIIYDADLFGLASLHQLRGRIGRDGSLGLCLLAVQTKEQEYIERLKVLEASLDGFYISEQDLLLRGPGEVIGVKQSGMPHFDHLNIIKDKSILEATKHFILEHHFATK